MGSLLDFVQIHDQRIISMINQKCKCRALDYIMNGLTRMGSVMVAILVPIALMLSDNDYLEATGCNLAIVLIISQIIVHSLKWLISRPRPFTIPDIKISWHPPVTGFSFPSGHSSAALAVALSLSHFMSALTIPLLLLAILVGFSRIYLGVHYPSDVLAGCILSLTVFLVCQAIFI